MSSTLVYTNPGAVSDTGIPILRRDLLLEGDSNGVRFLFDLANSFCYAAGTPTNAKAVKDLTLLSADGSITNPTGQLAAGGGGIDWTGVADGPGNISGILIPASVVADLWAAQRYMVCTYVKLPDAGNWPTANGFVTSFFSHSTGAWTSVPEIINLGFVGNGSISTGIRANRQVSSGSAEATTTGSGTNTTHGGLFAQIAAWRTATPTTFVRIKSSAGTTLVSGTAGASAANTQNFSAQVHGFGNLGTFGQYGIATHGNNYRMYRGFLENLATSGRDPVTVLDADYTRTIGRGAFS